MEKSMLVRNGFTLLAVSCVVAALAGCGGSANFAVPPPTGSFTNSNLTGTYVFSFSGYDVGYENGSFFAVAGTLTANGSGELTGGTIDVVDPSLGEALGTAYSMSRLPVSGTYNVTPDGRGSGVINFTVNGSDIQFGLDFVLTSGSHGLITRFDSNGSGSGTIDLEASGVTQSALSGSWALGLNGVDSSTFNSLSAAGALTLEGNGNVTSGIEDFNDNGSSSNLQALTLTGTVSVGAPGAAQLSTNAPAFGTLRFDVWPIDSTHMKLIETDSRAYLEGDAFVSTGQTAFPAGQLAFTFSGEDTEQGSFAAGGLLSSDGASTITGGLEDVNDEGDVGQASSINGSFSSSGPRTTLTLNGIYNGSFPNFALASGNYTFAAYPFNGGAMLLEIDNGGGTALGISGGNLYLQSATSLASSEGYGLNLSGANANGEVDMISEFTAASNTMSGLYDANNSGLLVSDASLGTGTWSVASNGRGTVSFPGLQTNGNSLIGALNLTFYVVDSSTVVFLETDTNQLATGAFLLQNATTASPAVESRFMLVHPGTTASRAVHFRGQGSQ
jgi:hypothetical protein